MQGSAYQKDGVQYVEIIAAIFGGYKRRALEFLDVRPGQRVLDVGCGVGDDALILAKMAGPNGRVVGIDLSNEMMEAAQTRAGAAPNVKFTTGDTYALPFPDGSFDRVRSDRLFQHLDRPAVALAEMVRVTTKGGAVCGVDVDWGTLTVNADDATTTKRILDFQFEQQVNGAAGRKLYELFRQAPLSDVKVYADAVCVTEWSVAKWVWGLEVFARRAAEAGRVSSDAAESWLKNLGDKDRAGTFFASMTGFAVRGTRV